MEVIALPFRGSASQSRYCSEAKQKSYARKLKGVNRGIPVAMDVDGLGCIQFGTDTQPLLFTAAADRSCRRARIPSPPLPRHFLGVRADQLCRACLPPSGDS